MFDLGFLPKGSLLKKLIWLKASGIVGAAYQTFTGTIARFLSPSSKPVKSIVCNIEPVQDLHGYDNPWPAGGGKNKIDGQDITIIASTDNQYAVTDSTVTFAAGTYTLSFTVGANVTATRNRPMYLVGSTPTYAETDYRTQGRQSWTFTLSEETTLQFKWWGHTLSANCTISDFMLETGSSASSFAPYSNLCPISGFTGLNVYGTGVNVWDEVWEVGVIDPFTGANVSNGTTIRAKNYVPILPETDYYNYVGDTSGGNNLQARFYDASKNYIGYVDYAGNAVRKNAVFKTPAGARFMRFALQADYGTTYNNDISINYPSTDHDYHAYVGTTLPVSWQSEAGTVYAGRLDVVRGLLTVDRVGVDLGGASYTKNTALTGIDRFILVANDAVYVNNNTKTSAICSIYAADTLNRLNNTFATSGFAQFVTNFYFFTAAGTYADASAFSTAMTGQTLVYPLATPLTYTLSSVTVPSTVQGENNWWHDANGNITIEAIGTPISSDEPDALQSLNILLGGAYTPRANFSEPTDEQALNIILGR